MAKALTPLSVKKAKPAEVRQEIADAGCKGLYLVIQPGGSKSWAFRYRLAGSTKKLTLGPAYLGDDEIAQPALDQANTLAGARKLAGEAALLVAKGIDPAKQKFATRERARQYAEGAIRADRLTVEVLARQFIRDHAMTRTRESSWRQTARLIGLQQDATDPAKLVWTATGGEVLGKWGKRPAHEITLADVNDLLRSIAARGSPITSNRVLAAIRKMFNWAVDEDLLSVSPCGGVKRKADEHSRDRKLSDDELRLVWKASGALGYPFEQFTKLLILTLQRRAEVAGIRRTEVNATKRLWTLPRERVKNDVEHDVPLSETALAVLRSCKDIGESGFYLTRYGEVGVSGYSKAKIELDAEILKIQKAETVARGEKPDSVVALPRWTWHDLRRTGVSGLSRLGVPMPVGERIVNHVSGSFAGVVGVYQRYEFEDEKRAALDAWAKHVTGLQAVKNG